MDNVYGKCTCTAHAQHMHSTCTVHAQHMMHTVHNMNWSRMLCLSVQNSGWGGGGGYPTHSWYSEELITLACCLILQPQCIVSWRHTVYSWDSGLGEGGGGGTRMFVYKHQSVHICAMERSLVVNCVDVALLYVMEMYVVCVFGRLCVCVCIWEAVCVCVCVCVWEAVCVCVFGRLYYVMW